MQLLGILDGANSLKDRENTNSGASPTDCSGVTPSTDASRASHQRPAPDDGSAGPVPAGAEPSPSSTRTTARLEASHHTQLKAVARSLSTLWAFARSLTLDAVAVATLLQQQPGLFQKNILFAAVI
jgi:hypothetical protein